MAQKFIAFVKTNYTTMANIDVQRKKSSPLLWILIILAILGLAAYFLWNRYGNKTENTNTVVHDSTTTIHNDTTKILDTTKHQ